jgi:capsular polysaccharide biosynthesis protein
MMPGDRWPRVANLNDLLASRGTFPRLLTQPPPERIGVQHTLWRALSCGLDRPAAAKLFDAADYVPPHHHLARFRDAAVFPDSGLVMPSPGQVWAYSSWPARWGDPELSKIPGMQSGPDGTQFDVAAWREAPRVKERVAIITSQFSFMYGHWLCDSISGVIWFLPAVRDGRLRLLARPLTDWQRAVLEHLEIPHTSIVERDDPILRCDDVIVSSFLGASEIGHPSPMQRDNFAALRKDSVSEGPALIYIARDRIERSRTMVNEDAVIARLSELGFAILRPERMSFAEQVRAFSHARIIVGAHGSGMANIGLAPAGCVVLEIMPEYWIQAWTLRLCAVLGHRYVGHVADVDPRSRMVIAHDGKYRFPDGLWFSADVDRLVSQAREISLQIGVPVQ